MSLPFGSLGRFELYGIEIEKLTPDRDLGAICYGYFSDRQILYERVEREKIPIGHPLPLRDMSRPVPACYPVDIVFNDPKDPRELRLGWLFSVRYDREQPDYIGSPQKVIVIDLRSGSSAIIRYGLLPCAVDATIQLQYQGNPGIKIFNCQVYATTNGDVRTKRLLLSTDSNEPHQLRSGQMITLNRSVVGVPRDGKSYLGVMVFVTYVFPLDPRLKKSKSKLLEKYPPTPLAIDGVFIERFNVPDSPTNPPPTVFFLSDDRGDEAPRLNLTVKWTDELSNYISEMVFKPATEVTIKLFAELGIVPNTYISHMTAPTPDEGKPMPMLDLTPGKSTEAILDPTRADAAMLDYSSTSKELEDYPELDAELGEATLNAEVDYSSIFKVLEDYPKIRVQVGGTFPELSHKCYFHPLNKK